MPDRSFVCPYCHAALPSQEALDEHLRVNFAVSIRAQLEAARARETLGLDRPLTPREQADIDDFLEGR